MDEKQRLVLEEIEGRLSRSDPALNRALASGHLAHLNWARVAAAVCLALTAVLLLIMTMTRSRVAALAAIAVFIVGALAHLVSDEEDQRE